MLLDLPRTIIRNRSTIPELVKQTTTATAERGVAEAIAEGCRRAKEELPRTASTRES